jgi:hypothetical protein
VTRRIVLGAVAGLLSALVSLGAAYVVGVVAIALHVKEFLPTVLAAATVLPLMLLFVVLIPSLVIGLLTGVTIGGTARYGAFVYFIGPLAGLLFGLFVISGVLPLIFESQLEDFTYIATRPLWTGLYGFFLGLLAARFFRWFHKEPDVLK